jgi:cytochrome c
VATATLASTERATATEALAKSNKCLNCHAIDAKTPGLAFKTTAAKYKDQPMRSRC